MKEKFYNYIQNLQLSITREIEKVDGKSKFGNIKWQREGGGGGTGKQQRCAGAAEKRKNSSLRNEWSQVCRPES